MVASWVLSTGFQVFLYIITFVAFMLFMEFFRWFPVWNLYLSFIATIVFFPIQIGVIPGIDAGGFGRTAKFLLICPFLVILCAWRLSYTPINEKNKFEAFTIKFCKKIFFWRKDADTKRPTVVMEWFWFLLCALNILVAVYPLFYGELITNSIAGILLAISFPIPQRSLKLNYYHNVYVTNRYNAGRVYDGSVDGLDFFWVVCFTSWELCFVFAYVTGDLLMDTFHVIPNCIRCIVTGQYDLWAELRVFTFAVALMMYAPMRGTTDPINDWYLNTENVPFLMEQSTNQWVIEIWGTINLILIIIHCVIWGKELYRRKDVPEDQVKQPLIVDVDEEQNVASGIEFGDANVQATVNEKLVSHSDR